MPFLQQSNRMTDLSFIVIGRNVSKTITICIDSIIATIKENSSFTSEIIYVDSGSTDNTLRMLSAYQDVKIVELIGEYNAAIGRNVGFKVSSGKILFFIDGDMELNPSFLKSISDVNNEIKYDFVSGDLVDYYYDQNGNYLTKSPYFGMELQSDRVEYKVGGVFIIKRHIWESVGGMLTKMRKCQDYDLGLRLAKKGVYLVRKSIRIVNHHTIKYADKSRSLEMFKNGDFLYQGVLNRTHCLNPFYIRTLLRNDYSLLVLLFSIIGSFLTTYYLISFYIFVVCIRSFLQRNKSSYNAIHYLQLFILRDLQVLFGLLFFFPAEKRIQYKKLVCFETSFAD
jgi:glycosyltransferase involved in cell wall biosynthesis